MNNTETILAAINTSNAGFLMQVTKLNDTVSTLNISVVKLNHDINNQSEKHTDLKDTVVKLEQDLVDVIKDVDELKVYGKLGYERRRWWSSNWMNIIKTVILCVSAVSVVAIAYANLTPQL